MPRTITTTMTVRLSGPLSEFVAANVGEHGAYENVSEYVRDLIRLDKDSKGAAVGYCIARRSRRRLPRMALTIYGHYWIAVDDACIQIWYA